jgi:3-phenylpropionate/trans-cinnamate dioxygenase ferredoxin subunit
MNFVKVTDVSEIPEGKMKAIKAGGKEILLANVGGTFHAIDNKCTHAHAPLSRGKLEGCIVTCPLHHATFDVSSGKNLSDARILFIKMKAKDSHSYSVKMDGDSVLVDLG